MIYIHIPFCKQACHYCDFHFSTNLYYKSNYISALLREIELQKDFFTSRVPLESLYFGGGTPSMLEISELGKIIDKVKDNFDLQSNAEITLEANPDDLSDAFFVEELLSLGVNRLSIGIQSFDAGHLRFMNRAHNADEAKSCVRTAQYVGFENISIDLIYGVQTDEVRGSKTPHHIWEQDLGFALDLGVKHISSYCLTIEPKTTLANWVKRGKLKAIEDEFAAQQFDMLIDTLERNGFEHYEISNFAKANFYARHNTAYWQDKPYLGLGASAHSYDGTNRFINVSNNRTYIETLAQGKLAQTTDYLTKKDRINEYFLTSLRTKWGISIAHLLEKYDYDFCVEQKGYIQELLEKNLAKKEGGHIILTRKGKFFADGIASDLFLD